MGFQDIPDNWANRYKQAVTLLKEIAKGNICLGASEKTDNTNDSVIVAPARIFTRDTLKGY
jgi:Mu-like prophage protein gp36